MCQLVKLTALNKHGILSSATPAHRMHGVLQLSPIYFSGDQLQNWSVLAHQYQDYCTASNTVIYVVIYPAAARSMWHWDNSRTCLLGKWAEIILKGELLIQDKSLGRFLLSSSDT